MNDFFYGIRKRRWCFLTLLHITVRFASHTCVLNCNVINAVPREIKIPKCCGDVLFVHLIGLSAKECTDSFTLFMDCPQFCSFTFLLTVFCVTSDMTQNQIKMQKYEIEFRVRTDWGLLGVCTAVKPVQVICVWLLEPCHFEVIPSILCTI
jgi:hypothetical protein